MVHRTATVSGQTVTFPLTDGANGDADLTVNGSISDPVVLGAPLPFPGEVGVGGAGACACAWRVGTYVDGPVDCRRNFKQQRRRR
ncbi:choice-of-anchor U domain-containing protein [Ottowia caeni]|uniref:choice-of-anchor U domain-containing protein n=1 Tax=Ottowia caeni TaxID=2870339 RepID=UPI003D71365E